MGSEDGPFDEARDGDGEDAELPPASWWQNPLIVLAALMLGALALIVVVAVLASG